MIAIATARATTPRNRADCVSVCIRFASASVEYPFFIEGEGKKCPPTARTTEAEVQAWYAEVNRELEDSRLDSSFVVRFQNPSQRPGYTGHGPLWNPINQYTEALRDLISELR